MSRVLVTGGNGNLGRLCVDELREGGHTVAIFDQVAPRPDIVADLATPTYVGSLTDGPTVEEVLLEFRPDAIVHLAAQTNPTDHPRLPAIDRFGNRLAAALEHLPARAATFESNVLGTYHLLDSAVRAGVGRIVAASSLCVLGAAFRISGRPFEVVRLPIDEEHPLRPEDSYSLSKLLNEQMYRAYAAAYGITFAAFRFPIIFYSHLSANYRSRFELDPGPIPNGIPPNLWMYVDGRDAAAAIRLALGADLDGFEAFYVATGRTIATSPARSLLRYRPDLSDLTRGMGDDDDLLSIDKATSLLGYHPQHVWDWPSEPDQEAS